MRREANIGIDLFSDKYQGQLVKVLDNMIDNNKRLNKKIDKEVRLFLLKNDNKPRTKTQTRLYNKSLQNFTHTISYCLAQDLLNYRLHQFGRWFVYMWNCPSLTPMVHRRLTKKYPYKSHHFLRMCKVIIPIPDGWSVDEKGVWNFHPDRLGKTRK